MKSEKVSVNINNDKLAAIDLLVEEELVANRSTFINEAIDLLIEKKQKTIDKILEKKEETISSNQWFIGLQSIDREYLMKFKENGIKMSLKGFGSLYINKDVDVDLINDSIEYISKKIKLHGTQEQINAINKIQ